MVKLTVRLPWRLQELDEGLRFLDGPNGTERAQLKGTLVSAASVCSGTVGGTLGLLKAEPGPRGAHLGDIAACHGILEPLR